MNDTENRSKKNGADFAESLIREMFAATPLFAYLGARRMGEDRHQDL